MKIILMKKVKFMRTTMMIFLTVRVVMSIVHQAMKKRRRKKKIFRK